MDGDSEEELNIDLGDCGEEIREILDKADNLNILKNLKVNQKKL